MSKRKTSGLPKDNSSKQALAVLHYQQDAKRLGLHSGHYEGWQIAQMLQNVDTYRDDLWRGRVENLPYVLLLMLHLQGGMKDVAYRAAILRGDKLRDAVPVSMAGELADLLTQFIIVADVNTDDIPDLRVQVSAYISGIRALHNNGDNGDLLREVAAQYYDTTTELTQWLTSFNIGGRPKGNASWRYWLLEQWERARIEYDYTHAEMRQYILDIYAPYQGNERVVSVDLDALQRQAINSLIRSNTPPDNYYGNMKRAIHKGKTTF